MNQPKKGDKQTQQWNKHGKQCELYGVVENTIIIKHYRTWRWRRGCSARVLWTSHAHSTLNVDHGIAWHVILSILVSVTVRARMWHIGEKKYVYIYVKKLHLFVIFCILLNAKEMNSIRTWLLGTLWAAWWKQTVTSSMAWALWCSWYRDYC